MIYVFQCYKEDGGCDHIFEIKCSMDEIVGLKPKCPSCKKKKPVNRNYTADVYVFDGPKTLGSLADKNSRTMSADHKEFLMKKHTAYRDKPFEGKLGEGMSLYERDSNGKRIPRE